MEKYTSGVGVGIYYYGAAAPRHLRSVKNLLHSGIPAFEIMGCAYPEMALAEVAREALESSCPCAVFIANDAVFEPSAVKSLAATALKHDAVVSGVASHGYFRKPEHSGRGLMDFTAVPLSVWKTLAGSEDRTYSNSAVVRSAFGDGLFSRPFFSPWLRNQDTSLVPIPIERSVYSRPDDAFYQRVMRAGLKWLHEPVDVSFLSKVKMHFEVAPGSEEKRQLEAKNGFPGLLAHYAFCLPMWGACDLEQQKVLWELEKAGALIIELHGCPYIDLARSALVAKARALGARGVFFIDHDILFKPDDALRMIEDAEASQDVISAVYCMRKTAHALIGAPDIEQGTKMGYFKNEKAGLYPALYSGLGFSAIPMAVFDALDAELPELLSPLGKVRPYFALDVNSDFYCGEDASFCGRVQGLALRTLPADPALQGVPGASAAGHHWHLSRPKEGPTKHKVWLDSRVRIFHMGKYHYALEDHSIAVPRFEDLEAVHCETREKMLEFFRSADSFDPDVRARTQGLDPGAEAPHSILGGDK